MAWAAALSGLAGGAVGGASGFGSAAQAQGYYAQNMNASQEWADYMRRTAYQSAVKDLQKAGLNPMLAYTQGAASSPGSSGGGPSVNADIVGGIVRGVSSAKEMMLLNSNVGIAEANKKRAAAEADAADQYATTAAMLDVANRDQEFKNRQAEFGLLNDQMNLVKSNNARVLQELAFRKYDEPDLRARASWVRNNPNLYNASQTGAAIQPFVSSAKGLSDVVNPIRYLRRPYDVRD